MLKVELHSLHLRYFSSSLESERFSLIVILSVLALSLTQFILSSFVEPHLAGGVGSESGLVVVRPDLLEATAAARLSHRDCSQFSSASWPRHSQLPPSPPFYIMVWSGYN